MWILIYIAQCNNNNININSNNIGRKYADLKKSVVQLKEHSKRNVPSYTLFKVCRVIAVPILLNGNKVWTLKKVTVNVYKV